MIVAGIYPSRRQAASMVALQREPYERPYPPMGDPPDLIWGAEKKDDGWHAVGRTLQELKAL